MKRFLPGSYTWPVSWFVIPAELSLLCESFLCRMLSLLQGFHQRWECLTLVWTNKQKENTYVKFILGIWTLPRAAGTCQRKTLLKSFSNRYTSKWKRFIDGVRFKFHVSSWTRSTVFTAFAWYSMSIEY